MNHPKKILHKIHTISINRTRKGLQRLDEFLLQKHPDFQRRIIEIPSSTINPLDIYTTSQATKGLVHAPIARVRGLQIFSPSKLTHPFRFALRKGSNYRDIRDGLSSYYTLVRSLNAAEWLGLKSDSFWHAYPAWAYLYPWQAGTPEQRIIQRKSVVLHDSREQGFELTIDHGVPSIGPVSSELLHLESLRLQNLWNTIQTSGYAQKPLNQNVKGNLLIADENQWCIRVFSGQHRVAVAAALRISTIPIELHNVIRLSDLPYWPQVKLKAFTFEDANTLFYRLINEELPPALNEWEAYVAKHATDEAKS